MTIADSIAHRSRARRAASCASAAVPAAAQEQSDGVPRPGASPAGRFTPGVVVRRALRHERGGRVAGRRPEDRLGQAVHASSRSASSSSSARGRRSPPAIAARCGAMSTSTSWTASTIARYLSLRERVDAPRDVFREQQLRAGADDRPAGVERRAVPAHRARSTTRCRRASRRASRRRWTWRVRYEKTWVDFVRKDTNLTGGIVNGIQTELTLPVQRPGVGRRAIRRSAGRT